MVDMTKYADTPTTFDGLSDLLKYLENEIETARTTMGVVRLEEAHRLVLLVQTKTRQLEAAQAEEAARSAGGATSLTGHLLGQALTNPDLTSFGQEVTADEVAGFVFDTVQGIIRRLHDQKKQYRSRKGQHD